MARSKKLIEQLQHFEFTEGLNRALGQRFSVEEVHKFSLVRMMTQINSLMGTPGERGGCRSPRSAARCQRSHLCEKPFAKVVIDLIDAILEIGGGTLR